MQQVAGDGYDIVLHNSKAEAHRMPKPTSEQKLTDSTEPMELRSSATEIRDGGWTGLALRHTTLHLRFHPSRLTACWGLS